MSFLNNYCAWIINHHVNANNADYDWTLLSCPYFYSTLNNKRYNNNDDNNTNNDSDDYDDDNDDGDDDGDGDGDNNDNDNVNDNDNDIISKIITAINIHATFYYF